jgi:hypothetical protein
MKTLARKVFVLKITLLIAIFYLIIKIINCCIVRRILQDFEYSDVFVSYD